MQRAGRSRKLLQYGYCEATSWNAFLVSDANPGAVAQAPLDPSISPYVSTRPCTLPLWCYGARSRRERGGDGGLLISSRLAVTQRPPRRRACAQWISCRSWNNVRMVFRDEFYNEETGETREATYTYLGVLTEAGTDSCALWSSSGCECTAGITMAD